MPEICQICAGKAMGMYVRVGIICQLETCIFFLHSEIIKTGNFLCAKKSYQASFLDCAISAPMCSLRRCLPYCGANVWERQQQEDIANNNNKKKTSLSKSLFFSLDLLFFKSDVRHHFSFRNWQKKHILGAYF